MLVERAPARKALPDSQRVKATKAVMPRPVPTNSQRVGPEAARTIIMKGVKGGTQQRILMIGMSGWVMDCDMKIMGMDRINIMGPTRV